MLIPINMVRANIVPSASQERFGILAEILARYVEIGSEKIDFDIECQIIPVSD